MVCLDTDIIINFLRNEETAVSLIKRYKEENHTLTTTAINGFELWKGAYRSSSKKAHNAVSHFLSEIKVLPLTNSSSKKSAEIFEQLAKEGEMVDTLDVMIASIAILNNERILTRNTKHFAKIPGLSLASE